jgi:RNA polymerase sigma-70 factor (family 1)
MITEREFSHIYETYWAKLYSVCYFTVNAHEVAQDLVMEIFLAVWKNRETTEIQNLEHYLVKAAKYKSIKYITSEQRNKSKFKELLQRQLIQRNHDLPTDILEAKELNDALVHSIYALPAKTREIFLLNREEGLTYSEIAIKLGLSVKTVEYHISKALKILNRMAYLIMCLNIL